MDLSEGGLPPHKQRELGEILWGYGDQLQRVEVLLEAQLAFASSGRDRHLGVLAGLLEEAATRIGELDLQREVLLGHDPTRETPALRDLADGAEDAWSAILADHHRSLSETVQRIQHLVDQNRHTMASTVELLTRMTAGLTASPVTGYDRTGQTVRSSTPAVLFDGQA